MQNNRVFNVSKDAITNLKWHQCQEKEKFDSEVLVTVKDKYDSSKVIIALPTISVNCEMRENTSEEVAIICNDLINSLKKTIAHVCLCNLTVEVSIVINNHIKRHKQLIAISTYRQLLQF